jgi:hypothetical protein
MAAENESMKKAVGGAILLFLGLFMLAGFKPVSNLLVDGILILLFALAPIAGVLLIRNSYVTKIEREKKVKAYAEQEKQVLKLAREKEGVLTVPEIVAETSMNADEADELMRELVLKRYADMKITDQGTVIYEFLELTRGYKERSRQDLLKEDREIN